MAAWPASDGVTVPAGVWECFWMYTRQLLYREESAIIARTTRLMACASVATRKLWENAQNTERRTFYAVREVRSHWSQAVPVMETSVCVYESMHMDDGQLGESYVLPNEYLGLRCCISMDTGGGCIGGAIIPSVTASSFLVLTYSETTPGLGNLTAAPWVKGAEFALSERGCLAARRELHYDGELICATWLAEAGYAVLHWEVGYSEVMLSVGKARAALRGTGWSRGDHNVVVGCCCISCVEMPDRGGWKGDVLVVSRKRGGNQGYRSCLDVKVVEYEYAEQTATLSAAVVDAGAYAVDVEGGSGADFEGRLDAAKALQIVTGRPPVAGTRKSVDASFGLICGAAPTLAGDGCGHDDVVVDCVLHVRGHGSGKAKKPNGDHGMRLHLRESGRDHTGPVRTFKFSPDVSDANNRRPVYSCSKAARTNAVPCGVQVTFANIEQWQDGGVCSRGVSLARKYRRAPSQRDTRGASVETCLHRDRMLRFASVLATNDNLRRHATKSIQLVANGPKGHHRAVLGDADLLFSICGGRPGECSPRQHVWEAARRDGQVLLSSDVLAMGDLVKTKRKRARSITIPATGNPINAA